MAPNEFSKEELEKSKRIQKSQTPKGTVDWYIKWISSISVLFAVAIRSSNVPELHMYDVFLSWVGALGWFVVGFLWKDRALVLLNGVIGIMLFGSLLRTIFGA